MAKEKASGKTSGAGRTRNFATTIWPDSIHTPADWQDILSEQHIPVMISPLHDKDINPDGEPKKAHYHVMICFEGVKTPEQAKAVFDLVGGVGLEVVQSLRGYARYLCHMDNPEKYQYDTAEVRCLSGADFATAVSLVTDKYKAVREMIEYCKDNNVISFSELLEWAMVERYEWFRVLCDNGAVIMEKYLKSRKWTADSSGATNDFLHRVVEQRVEERLKELGRSGSASERSSAADPEEAGEVQNGNHEE